MLIYVPALDTPTTTHTGDDSPELLAHLRPAHAYAMEARRERGRFTGQMPARFRGNPLQIERFLKERGFGVDSRDLARPPFLGTSFCLDYRPRAAHQNR